MSYATDQPTIARTRDQLWQPLDRKKVRVLRGKDYLSIGDVIEDTNRAFDPTGWSHRILDLTQRCAFPPQQKKDGGWTTWEVCYTCHVRVTLHVGDQVLCVKDGIGVGTGYASRAAEAIDTATKAAESDAVKRALRYLGPRWGLAFYVKDEETKRGMYGQPMPYQAENGGAASPPAGPVPLQGAAGPSGIPRPSWAVSDPERWPSPADAFGALLYGLQLGITDPFQLGQLLAIPPRLCQVLMGDDSDEVAAAELRQAVRSFAVECNLDTERFRKLAADQLGELPEAPTITQTRKLVLALWSIFGAGGDLLFLRQQIQHLEEGAIT